jgi:hypothetical protein
MIQQGRFGDWLDKAIVAAKSWFRWGWMPGTRRTRSYWMLLPAYAGDFIQVYAAAF